VRLFSYAALLGALFPAAAFAQAAPAPADPPKLVLKEVSRTGYDITTVSATGITYGSGTHVSSHKYWVEDGAGRRIPAAEFALLFGDEAKAAEVARKTSRLTARTALLAGLGAFAGGALLLAANRGEGGSDALFGAGALALIGGEAAIITGLVTSGKRASRAKRLDPWYSYPDARRLVEEYNRAR
jgi:hypothetical protein